MNNKDTDQTAYAQQPQMPRLIWVFAGRTCHFIGFVMEAAHLAVNV